MAVDEAIEKALILISEIEQRLRAIKRELENAIEDLKTFRFKAVQEAK